MLQEWRPFEALRREVDRLFDDFNGGSWMSPFRQRSTFDAGQLFPIESAWAAAPTVDIVDKGNAYQVIAELPGMDEKNVEVKLSGSTLTIKGEKLAEKEEKKKDYYLRERRFGAFERSFTIPDTVNAEKIEASVSKGVLTVTLPKKAEAVTPQKKIEVKAAA
jgi:HSP20 family protein